MSSQMQPAQSNVCELCGQTLTRLFDLTRHWHSKHNRFLDAMCPMDCSKQVSGAIVDKQIRHMTNDHPGAPNMLQWTPAWIERSGVQIYGNQIPNMPLHLPPSQSKTCNICHHEFARPGDANHHNFSEHPELHDAVCPMLCGARISGTRIREQKAHMRNVHPEVMFWQQWVPVRLEPYAAAAAARAPLPNAVNLSSGYWPHHGNSDLIASAAPTNTGIPTPANGVISMSNSRNIAYEDMANGPALGENDAGEHVPNMPDRPGFGENGADSDVVNESMADVLSWAFEQSSADEPGDFED